MSPGGPSTGFGFAPAGNRIIPQPKGCVGIMVPFNFPINLAVGPLTSAVAAGNRAMLKMSELTPAIGELFAGLVADRFSPEQAVVVNGGMGESQEVRGLPLDPLRLPGPPPVAAASSPADASDPQPPTPGTRRQHPGIR